MYKQETYDRIRAALAIDAVQIDRELIEFPMMLMDVTEAVADCGLERDRKEGAYKLALSLAQAQLRELAGPDGKKRPETAILSEAPLDENVQTALADLEDAKASLAYWNALLTAMMAKQSSIKRLAELTAAGFSPSNSSYQGTREAMAAKRQAAPARATLQR